MSTGYEIVEQTFTHTFDPAGGTRQTYIYAIDAPTGKGWVVAPVKVVPDSDGNLALTDLSEDGDTYYFSVNGPDYDYGTGTYEYTVTRKFRGLAVNL